MSIKVLAQAVLVLALAVALAPAASAVNVDGGGVEYTVEEEKLEFGEGTDAVRVDGGASTGRTDVRVDGPSCSVTAESDVPAAACEGLDVETTTTGPSVDVDVHVALIPEQSTVADEDVATQDAGAAPVVTPEIMSPLVLATAVAGAGLVGAYGVWRGVRFLAFAGLIPLYSHIRDDELLDDPNRSRIFALIRDEPGVSTKDVADRLALAWGTVTHHLGKLEKRRLVVSKKYGKYRRYFVNGAVPGAGGKDALAVLRVEKTADIAAHVRENPGLTQKEVSAAIGVSPSTVLWHVKRLERAGLVEKVREGKHVKYYATPALTAGSAGGSTRSVGVPATS